MSARAYRILISVLFLLITQESDADTTWVAGGNISGHWSRDGSPYMILGDIQLPANETLFIGPGVTVFFTVRCTMWTDTASRIEAVGAPGDSIYFTTDTVLVPEGWASIPLGYGSDTCRFEYCVFEYAREPGFGGVFWDVRCPLILRASTFRFNSVPSGWAGVAELGWTWVYITDCLFESNFSAQGGVFSINETRGVIQNCIFRNNHTEPYNDWTRQGGAIYFGMQHDTLIFRHCEFLDNSAGSGGAIHFATSRPSLLFDSCRFAGNHATLNGGAIADVHNIIGAQFLSCVFDSNRADSLGGAVYMFSNRFDQCIISHNEAANGGGLYIPQSLCFPPSVTRCDIIGNAASRHGAGIYLDGPATIQANIIAYSPSGEGIYVPPQDTTRPQIISHNLLYANAGGEFSFNQHRYGEITTTNANGDSCDQSFNLLLDPRITDVSHANYRLLEDSPCIDAGSLDLPYDPDTTIADIGAFYYAHSAAVNEDHASVQRYELQQNFPNPFNASTRIRFDVPKTARIELNIFNMLGQRVATLVNAERTVGAYTVSWDARTAASGMYIYQLKAGDFVDAKKMLLIR